MHNLRFEWGAEVESACKNTVRSQERVKEASALFETLFSAVSIT
jgi:hypothetical protein